MTDIIDSLVTQFTSVLEDYVTEQGQGMASYEVRANKFDTSIIDFPSLASTPEKYIYLQLRSLPFYQLFENGTDVLITASVQVHIILDNTTMETIGTLNEVIGVVNALLDGVYTFNGKSIQLVTSDAIYPTQDTDNNKFYFDLNIKYL